MSRRKRVLEDRTEADAKYNSILLSKFINKMMYGGKKSTAQAIVYKALEDFAQKVSAENALQAFEQAIENAKPSVEVKSKRIGGSTYQVPVEIRPKRRTALAMQWIITYARAKKGRAMKDGLASELIECFQGQGNTIKKRDDVHRMAEANRAFAHYGKM